jgi:NADH:ubiquinone oxidoreductase subunit 4 (subunit M)
VLVCGTKSQGFNSLFPPFMNFVFFFLLIMNFFIYQNPLFVLLFVYFICIFSLFLIPYKKLEVIRFFGFSISVFLFVWSLWLWVLFDDYLGNFQFIIQFNNLPLFGIDGLSLIFIILTTFIFVCSFLLIWSITSQLKFLIILLLSL